MVDRVQLYSTYDAVKQAVQSGCGSGESGQKNIYLTTIAFRFLGKDCEPVALLSKVPGKEYISFARNGVLARPANLAYFTNSPDEIADY